MRKGQKVLTVSLWGLTVVAMMAVIGAGLLKRQRDRDQAGFELILEPASTNGMPSDVLGKAPQFSLVDQENQPFTSQSLLGRTSVVDFIFTNCAGPCPIMTAKMAKLQKTIGDPSVQFVSVSIDPENDTPEVLKRYAEKHGADRARWRFLTGSKDAVLALARGMLVTAIPAQGSQPILHSTKFLLIDSAGQIRGAYESGDEQDMAQLMTRARELSREPVASSGGAVMAAQAGKAAAGGAADPKR